MDELLSIPIHKELNVIQINLGDGSIPNHKLENIPLDTSVLELQEQIYCKTDVHIENQYLFFVSPIDSYFYGLIDDLFSMKNFLARNKVLEFLDKLLHENSEVELTKTRISREMLVEELERKKITSYLKPLNINFRNGIEFVRIDKAKNLSDTFIENNQTMNLTNFTFVENKIFMFSKDDIQDNLENEIKDDIIEKYFLDTKTKQTKTKICETSEEVLSIYQDGENMRKFRAEYSKNINEFIENRISELTLLYTNFLVNECDIQKIFNTIKLDGNVVFSKISMRRKKHYYKIFKPKYFGDGADITKKQFNSWRNIEFTSREKELFDTNAFIVFKILYSKNNYITLLINQKNQLLIKLESDKIELDKLRDIIFLFLDSLNSIVDCFKNIEGSKFMLEDNYSILDMSFIKEILVDKNIPIKNLRTLLENKSKFIFSLDYPINDRKFSYGYKRTSNFMIDKNINHLIEKMVFTEGQTDGKAVKARLKTIFPTINVDEMYASFLSEYIDDRKSKYKLEIPHFTVSTFENKFIIKMRNFDRLAEIQIVSLLLKNIFEEFMVKKSTNLEQPAIRTSTELTLTTDESSNEESTSNINSNSSSPKGALVGLNSNSEDENSLSSSSENAPATQAPADEEGEIDISFGYIGNNYTTYMRAMRSHYDKKDELFTKGSNYTTKCRRQPYIVSKSHFDRNINKPNRYNTKRGLDHMMINPKGDMEETTNYYLESWDKKTVYICPRIWCVKCNLPVDPIHFGENNTCPKCGGSEIQGNGRMTDDKTIIVVNAENDYFKTDDKKKNYLQKIFESAGKPVPKELENNEQRMYPKFLDAKNPDVKKRLPCCYKGMKDEKKELVTDEGELTQNNRPEVTDQKIFRFITESKFPMKKLRRLAILSEDLDIMLDNTETGKIVEKLDDLSQSENKMLKDLKSKRNPTAKQADKLKELEIKKKGYEYSFKFYGERKNIGFKKELSSYKLGDNYVSDNLFRLSVGDNKKTSFLDCIEELSILQGEFRRIDEVIENEDLFTPLLFSQLNNGNLIEIFKSEVDDEESFARWKEKYSKEIDILKIRNDKSIKNLYTSFTNFKKYNASDSYKNPDFYLDLLGREGLIFDEAINIIILEKTSYDDDAQINLVCPKSFLGAEHINIKNNSLILLNTGLYYEPVIGIRFITRKMELNKTIDPFEPIIFFNSNEINESQISRSNITTILKLMINNCNEIKEDYRNNVFQNNLDNLHEIRKKIGDDNISKYIIGNNCKIVAILLKNKLLLPIIPSGLKSDILNSLETLEFVKRNLISIEEFQILIGEGEELLESYQINQFVSDDENIHSLLLKNGTIIPIKREPIEGRETINIEDIEIDDLLLERVEDEDDRVKFNIEYNNYTQEQGLVKFIFNSFIREEDQEEERDLIKKIVINPVMPIVEKKRRLIPIISSIISDLFSFKTKPDIFGKGKKTKKCYKTRSCDENCEEKSGKCKNKITKKNILTDKDNKIYYIEFLTDELIRKNDGIELITKKLNMLSEMDVSVAKDEIVFPDDLFEFQETDLYRKTKEKFVRNIEIFNTINQNNNKDIDDEGLQKIKTGKTKIVKKKKSKLVQATNKNMFGNKIVKSKIKSGECIFPYKLTLKQKQSTTNTKKTSTTKIMDDCVPSVPERKTNGSIIGADGLFCPTKVAGIYDNPENFNTKGKHTFWKQDTEKSKPFYLYEEKEDTKPKGYCDTREYLERIKTEELSNKKINPKCIPTFKIKKSSPHVPTNFTENGKEYTCLIENNPDKIIDKFKPQFICPTEVDKDGVYDRVKTNKTEPCFVDK